MKSGEFGFNWFDLVMLAVLGVGLFRGRSRGMSEELLDVLKWLTIVVVAAFAYGPLGSWLADYTHISRMSAYLAVYIGTIIFLRFLYGCVKRMVGEKLVGSDVFGSGEYYLGMVAGTVRFACYALVALALLNADYISPEQLAAEARVQQDNFGDISFPTIGSLQQTVFTGSASGQLVKKYLGHELIVTTPAEMSSPPADTIGRQRERAVSEVLGDKK